MSKTQTTERDEAYFSVFVTALEGGIGYWSQCLSYHWDKADGTGDDTLGFYAEIVDVEEVGEPEYKITRATIATGVTRAYEKVKDGTMQNKYHRAAIKNLEYGDFEDLDFDSETADYIVQCGLFGEAVYG